MTTEELESSGQQQVNSGCHSRWDRPPLQSRSQASLPRFWDLMVAPWKFLVQGEFWTLMTQEAGGRSGGVANTGCLGLPCCSPEVITPLRDLLPHNHSEIFSKHHFWFFSRILLFCPLHGRFYENMSPNVLIMELCHIGPSSPQSREGASFARGGSTQPASPLPKP